MEKELAPEVIKATQTSLGKFLKRPPLTEKLLKKPPFRFLHDIVTSVLKTNGFFEGLFDENELISDNVKDRDSKILFLNKVISVTALTTGKNLSVKPSKIVAGQEPEKTNELLQILAYALDKKLTSDEAVKKYKENAKLSQTTDVKSKELKPIKKINNDKKFTSKSSEKLTSGKKESASVNKNEKSKTGDPKSKKKETVLSKNEPQIKKTQNLKKADKKPSDENITQSPTIESINQEHQEKKIILSEKEVKQKEEIELAQGLKTQEILSEVESNADLNALKSDQEIQGKLNNSYTIAENELNSSLSSQDLMEIDNNKIDEGKLIESSTQESSADLVLVDEVRIIGTQQEPAIATKDEADETLKKAKPILNPKHNSFDSEIKPKELIRTNSNDNPMRRQTTEVVRPASVRPSSSRPGAPRLREKIDNVISDSENIILGKVNIITENAQNDEEEDTSVVIVQQIASTKEQQDETQLLSDAHGHLVQQILNSQKEMSHVTGKTEIEWQYGAHKAMEASSQEIEQLRFNIQALSRVANPLGKLLDHIQEDVEVMRQELHQWTNIYEEVSKDMLKQKAANEELLEPLLTRVKQLDMDIEEKRDKISDIKILIHKNTTRIEKLLANGNVQ